MISRIKAINRLLFLVTILLILVSISDSFPKNIHIGIISAVKNKVEQLKEKKREKSVQIISISQGTVKAIVGPEGGTVSTQNGEFALVIPRSALAEQAIVEISAEDPESIVLQPYQCYSFHIYRVDNRGSNESQSRKYYAASKNSENIISKPLTVNYKLHFLDLYPWNKVDVANFKILYHDDNKNESRLSLNSFVDRPNEIITAEIPAISNVSEYIPVNFLQLNEDLGNFHGISAYSNYHVNKEQINAWNEVVDPKFLVHTGTLNYVNGVYAGEQWQCVEYVFRYYLSSSTYNCNIRLNQSNDNAANFWDMSDCDSRRGLNRYKNPNKELDGSPKEGDIVVFAQNDVCGHVAIVREVTDDYIHIIQQNWFLNKGDGDTLLEYNKKDNYVSHINKYSSTWKVKGWLRLKNLSLTASIAANPTTVYVGNTSTITCTVSNSTGGTLSYVWDKTGGTFSGFGLGPSQVIWTAPPSSGTFTISVTASDGNNSSKSSADISVIINQSPIISSLTANPTSISTGAVTTITCTVSDPDVGDTLSYSWGSASGTISGSGSQVSWTAPSSSGTYTVNVTVSDGMNSSQANLNISVTAHQAPIISSLAASQPIILPSGNTSISCTATDPDGEALSYSWNAASGTISGSGNQITWTAPAIAGIYSVMCTVSNTSGLFDQESVAVRVGEWLPKTSMLTARDSFAVGIVNNKIYAFGGWTGGANINKVEEYDTQTDSWSAKPNMSTGRHGMGAGVVNGKIYSIGGIEPGSYLNKTTEYDPILSTWIEKNTMPTRRTGLGVVVANNKIYAIGGQFFDTSWHYYFTVEEYDPQTDTWVSKASMPTARSYLCVAVVNNKIYALGGYDGAGPLSCVEEYDIASNSWTTKMNMPTARYGADAVAMNNKIYVIGGDRGTTPRYYSKVEVYDPATDSWSTETSMPTERSGVRVGIVNNKIYAIGGINGEPSYLILNTVEEAQFIH